MQNPFPCSKDVKLGFDLYRYALEKEYEIDIYIGMLW